jgi:hypothetical protein
MAAYSACDCCKMKARIAGQIYALFEKYGAMSDVLGTIGSYGDTLSDEDVLSVLVALNDHYAETPLPKVGELTGPGSRV